MKRALLLTALLLMAGCESLPKQTNDQMRKVLGQPLATLIKKWGPPTERRVVDGKRLATFRTDAAGVAVKVAPSMAAASYCDSTVEINDRDVVIGYYWAGSHCEVAADRL
jgi:hypothetical protein